jgi:uncharacterized repeat protein (TIGR03803 family)
MSATFWATVLAALLAANCAGQTQFSTLYKFGGTPDGRWPNGLVAANGALYGTTLLGGLSDSGTVFQLVPPAEPGGKWTEAVLYSFTGENGDGSGPVASPVIDAGGILYGTTAGGGPTGSGTAFELVPPAMAGEAWTETVLYSFTGQVVQTGDGWNPSSGLVLGAGGALYGTTWYGGSHDFGTVFRLRPPGSPGGVWTETVLYSFPDYQSLPESLTIGDQGVLYGTTLAGGSSAAGTIFRLSPPVTPGGAWTETTLYTFTGGADGCGPITPLILAADGSLYGTTFGAFMIDGYPWADGDATVFQFKPPATPGGSWTKAVLRVLGHGNRRGPDSTIILRDGFIYGAAGDYGLGAIVFQLHKPALPGDPWPLTMLHHFMRFDDPGGRLVMDKDGVLFGVTINLTEQSLPGTVYRIKP